MKNKLIVIAGPSGVGKTTIQKFLSETCEVFVPTCVTTRKKREDDTESSYLFVDEETWNKYDENGCYFLTTGGADKYGFVKNDDIDLPYVITTSYKNLIKLMKTNNNVEVILLSYSNIELELPKRIINRNTSTAEFEKRIKYAVDDYFNYFGEALNVSDIFLYTDLYTVEEVNQIILDYLLSSGVLKKKESQALVRKG